MKSIDDKILVQITDIKNTRNSWLIAGLICLCPLFMFLISQAETNGIFFLAGVLGVIFASFSIIYPRFWVYSTIALLPLYLISRDKTVNPMEMAVYAYILSGLLFWFISMLLVKRERIVHNWGDFFLITFIIFSFFNIIIGYLNDVNMFDWFKEYTLYCLYLLYFPYRYYLKTESNIKAFLIILSISVILIAGYQLYHFREVALMATFAYELQSTLRINLTIIAFGAILGILGIFKYQEYSVKFLMLALLIGGIAIVITSFARTTWLIEMALIGLIFFTLNRKQRIVAAVIGSTSILIMVIAMMSMVNNLDVYWEMMNKKFLSTGGGKKDISVMSRVVEYKSVWRAIEENPISGNGYSKIFAHKDILSKDQNTIRKTFTHNSFLQLVYNVGTPTALTMTIFVFYYFWISTKMTFFQRKSKRQNKFYPFLAFAGIFISVSHALVSAQFLSKETVMLIVISVLLINFAVDTQKKEFETEEISPC